MWLAACVRIRSKMLSQKKKKRKYENNKLLSAKNSSFVKLFLLILSASLIVRCGICQSVFLSLFIQ